MPRMKTVLCVGGFDPSSGAGVTADLAVAAAHGMFGTSCVTALTVQSTVGVKATQAVEPGLLRAMLEHLTADLPPAGIKIGMLANEGLVEAVAGFLEGRKEAVPVVLDPVIVSSSGHRLLDMGGLAAMRNRLLPWVSWMTPNMGELAAIAGVEMHGGGEEGRGDVERASRMLQTRWTKLGVVATGGDLERPHDMVMAPGEQAEWLAGEKIESESTHGTGCAFSTAMLCGLVEGLSGVEAARAAKRYVTEAIRRAEPRGTGKGPLELYWPLRSKQRT